MEKELSKLEQLKASRNPLRVIDDIYKEANEGVPLSEDYIGLLKWYGMYPHINHDDLEDKKYFMKRVKLVDASMNLEQLKVMAKIGKKYAQGLVDFTTRENVQFHYIQIKDLPEIFNMLESVGLTSRMASGDGPRPIVTCPVSGLDNNEIIDVTKIVKEIDTYFDTNEDQFCNFPRKYKLSVSGCACHCCGHEIQDIAFTAFEEKDEILFDLTIGGGLSKSKQIAYRANRYVKEEQIKDVSIAVAEIFRDNGNRHNRNKARIRHLINDWGVEKFVDEIENKIGYKLQVGLEEPEITPIEKRNHFGINKSKVEGESFIGFATIAGRVPGDDFEKFATILEKYDAKGIRLTTRQNFIVYGVKDEVAKQLADEFDALGYPYEPNTFRGIIQSCTGREFCKFGITETKNYTNSLIKYLEDKCADFDEYIKISVSGCGNACSHSQISDIGLIGCKTRVDGQRVEAYDIQLGGHLQGTIKSKFAQSSKLKIPADEVPSFIEKLINDYKKDNLNSKSFKEYLTKIDLNN
ncbi:ferredoxin-nitrite reductase [Malaciobacter marinus]|uniref:Ferredoxin--nitrite reductase n=1 Tax=Malaciobacter marinus TaxID=505249 RepID=A0A347TNB8_9BACT|nr:MULTISPECIES: nitrite/sulfite reductase [Malaciobacter]AXX88096.1 ferredoxin-nitrite reductase [Malaciobacter marinus]PHO15614.1 ferredoxin--nitrite reductase [Malaciobacter marinus]RYA24226.1 nitrite/sulfite reductase [Malaciobacter halophilus]